MKTIATLLRLVIAPALALVIGCEGVELSEESALGWLLFVIGAGYPPGAIIFNHRRQEHSFRRFAFG